MTGKMTGRKGKKIDDRGVAMMVCITIIAILMIFCFSLLAVSYNLYSSQNNSMQADKNAEAAKSLSMAIREELTADSEDSLLCKYLRYNIITGFDTAKNPDKVMPSWPDYKPGSANHEAADAKRYFKLNKSDSVSINGFPSNTEVCMWWTAPESEEEKAHLFVEVECRSGSQSYVVCSEYELWQVGGKNNAIVSTYPTTSTQGAINPAKNSIDRRYKWRWKFIGCE